MAASTAGKTAWRQYWILRDMNRSWVRLCPHIIGIILLTLATKYIPWVLGSDDRCCHLLDVHDSKQYEGVCYVSISFDCDACRSCDRRGAGAGPRPIPNQT